MHYKQQQNNLNNFTKTLLDFTNPSFQRPTLLHTAPVVEYIAQNVLIFILRVEYTTVVSASCGRAPRCRRVTQVEVLTSDWVNHNADVAKFIDETVPEGKIMPSYDHSSPPSNLTSCSRCAAAQLPKQSHQLRFRRERCLEALAYVKWDPSTSLKH